MESSKTCYTKSTRITREQLISTVCFFYHPSYVVGLGVFLSEIQEIYMFTHSIKQCYFLAEFLALMSHVGSAQDTEDELRNAFHVFDKDGSGTISASEMREVLKTLGEDLSEKEINEIMSAADTDGDKSIDCELFFFFSFSYLLDSFRDSEHAAESFGGVPCS